jgi:hypothetical protein
MRIELKMTDPGKEYVDCYAIALCGRGRSTDMYIPVQEGQTSQYIAESLKTSNLTLEDVCEKCLAALEGINAKAKA